MNPDTLSRAERSAVARRRSDRRHTAVRVVLRVVVTLTFLGLVYLAARLGVHMAKERVAPAARSAPAGPESGAITIGNPGNPVYLAESPESLRAFYAQFSAPGARASADLTDLGIRRLNSGVEMTILERQANSVRVRVISGPIAGAVYWVHHSQFPASPDLDPIISPVPE